MLFFFSHFEHVNVPQVYLVRAIRRTQWVRKTSCSTLKHLSINLSDNLIQYTHKSISLNQLALPATNWIVDTACRYQDLPGIIIFVLFVYHHHCHECTANTCCSNRVRYDRHLLRLWRQSFVWCHGERRFKDQVYLFNLRRRLVQLRANWGTVPQKSMAPLYTDIGSIHLVMAVEADGFSNDLIECAPAHMPFMKATSHTILYVTTDSMVQLYDCVLQSTLI